MVVAIRFWEDRPTLCKLGIHRPFKCIWFTGAIYAWHQCERCRYGWVSHVTFIFRGHEQTPEDESWL